MVRSLKLECKDCSISLFSLLTDCSVLYCVWHQVENQEYWISRSVDRPNEMLMSICWLYLCASGLVQADVSSWEYRQEEDNGDISARDDDSVQSNLESVDEADEDDDGNCHVRVSGGTHQVDTMENLPVVSFEDFEMEEQEEEERRMWQRLSVMENHRKYGTPLPLTEDMLSLHDARGNRACRRS